jgi:hypothetical protein
MPENNSQSSASKANPVKKALMQKQYGRALLYITLLVWGAQFMGPFGAVGAILVIYGLHRVLTDSTYSTSRKWIQSLLYIIVGTLLVFAVRSLVLNILIERWPNIFLSGMLSNIPYADQNFVSSSTPNIDTSSALADLESSPYVDAKSGFSIQYPRGWTINPNPNSANVEFDDPAENTVGVETVSADPAKAYNLETYARAVMYNFEHSAAPGNEVHVLNMGNTQIGEQPAYEYELTFNYIVNGP